MKVKSLQKYKPDCMLHALVNSGVVKSYKQAFQLNQGFKKSVLNMAIKANLNIKAVNKLLGSVGDGKIFTLSNFLAYALKELNVKYKNRPKYHYVKQISKSFTGIISVIFENNNGLHAVYVTKGHVFDSHKKTSTPFAKYTHQGIKHALEFVK
jgi:hypothetical protein